MGFLGEIEKRKQQAIQKELADKAALEKQHIAETLVAQEAAQKAIREQEKIERTPQGFLKECPIVTQILDQLYQFGYKDYFENVAEISGFKSNKYDDGFSVSYYTDYPNPYLDPIERSIPLSEFDDKASELGKKQLKAERLMEESYDRLGWPGIYLRFRELSSSSPNTMFCGHNLKGKTEPNEIGLNILFSKTKKFKQHDDYDLPIPAGSSGDFSRIYEHWDQNVYVRINSHDMATITGSSQYQVPLNNLRLFDDALEKAIRKPAEVYIKNVDICTSGSSNQYAVGDGPCLPARSLIFTLNGFIEVKRLKIGDFVWTVDKNGQKVNSMVIQIAKRPSSKNHKMANIILEDGRKLVVSPGHPTLDNKELGALEKGQILDGSRIVSIEILPYKEKYTYDILPSGKTGGYWANDILIGSTLSSKFKKMREKKIYMHCLSK